MDTIISLLKRADDRFGSRGYLKAKSDNGWIETTFSDADTITDQAAAWLIGRGYARGTRAIILSEGRPEWILGELALLKAGLISVPISIQLLPEEIPFRQNHSEAEIFMVSANLLPKLLQARESFEKMPMLILLSEPGEQERALLSDAGLSETNDWISWTQLLEKGSDLNSATPDTVKQSVEAIQSNDTATICYTSGTTGNPKGIMLTHGNYISNVTAASDDFELPEAEYETLVILPLDHSFAHTVAIYAGLYKGITLWFVDSRGGSSSILRNIPINLKEAQPHFLLTVPALSGNFMKKIREGVHAKGKAIAGIFENGLAAGAKIIGNGFNKPPLATRIGSSLPYVLAKKLIFPKVAEQVFGSRIKFFVGGGAILEVKQQEFFAALGIPVYQGYGLTEATPVICTNTPAMHKFGSSGAVINNVECRIMKDAETQAVTGETGEIVIRGGNTMKGYFKNEEASAEVLRDGWLWTGDLGYLSKDGFLYVVGREKALLINPSGEKYPPEEIEEAIQNASNLFNHIMVYCDHRNSVTAVVTLNVEECRRQFTANDRTTATAAMEYIKAEFHRYKDTGTSNIPAMWQPGNFAIIGEEFGMENGLINSTMKLVRRKVNERYADVIEMLYDDKSAAETLNVNTVEKLFAF